MNTEQTKTSLSNLIERGGIHYDVPGLNPAEVLSALIEKTPQIPNVSKDEIRNALLEREALMSTSIGRGIALPHPRNPIIADEASQFTALAFLQHPVDWSSLDGKPVTILLLILSASARQHLKILSEVNYICRQEDFYSLLNKRARKKDLLEYIIEAEKKWKT